MGQGRKIRHTQKNRLNFKNRSHLESGSHLKNRIPLGKIGYIQKNGLDFESRSHFEKWVAPWKIGSHLEKQVTHLVNRISLGELGHTWKNQALLINGSHLGHYSHFKKMAKTWKNLEKWVNLKKKIPLAKMGQTQKSGPQLKKWVTLKRERAALEKLNKPVKKQNRSHTQKWKSGSHSLRLGKWFTLRNAKISAVRSLADICFLHVLIRLIRCIIVSVCPLVF